MIAPGVERAMTCETAVYWHYENTTSQKETGKTASVATCAGRRGNYRFRPADVFVRLFLPSRIFIINDNFAKSILSLRKCKGAVQ